MVWEYLFGTSNEITFRVSATLAKLLEDNKAARRTLRKELSDIYAVRSRLIHGNVVDDSVVRKACVRAIDIAVQAVRACYRKGREWLSLRSSERSDVILLE
jgi:hypothetical protein